MELLARVRRELEEFQAVLEAEQRRGRRRQPDGGARERHSIGDHRPGPGARSAHRPWPNHPSRGLAQGTVGRVRVASAPASRLWVVCACRPNVNAQIGRT